MPLSKPHQRTVSSCFLFKGLDEIELSAFLSPLETQRFNCGQEIYTQSCFRRAIGILVTGTAIVCKSSGVELNRLQVGDCFGAAGLFHPAQEYVTIVKAASVVRIVFISDVQLKQLFADYPQTAINYISFLSRRIYFLNREIDRFTAPTTLAGVRLYLLEQEQDGQVAVSEGYSCLARRLNIGRASLYRSLDGLERQGLIRRKEKIITILNKAALAEE